MAITWQQRVFGAFAVLGSIAIATTGGGTAQAGFAHPCGPGETDVIGTIDDVWYCDVRDQNDPPPPPPPPAPGEVPSRPVVAPGVSITADGSPSTYVALSPERVLDTRRPGGTAVAAEEIRRVDISAVVPAGSVAAAINLTAADAEAPGYLAVWDCEGARPPTSVVNFAAGGAASANTIVQLDGSANFCAYASATAHVLVDVNGSYATGDGLRYTAVSPRRIHDSRPSRVSAGSTTRIVLGDLDRQPRAAFLNLTVASPGADGFLTVWPCSSGLPEVSNLNYRAGVSAIANAAQVAVDPNGEICVYSSADTALIVDLFGVYDESPTGLRYVPTNPARILDTRSGIGGFLGAVGNNQSLYVSVAQLPVIVGTLTAIDPPQDGYLLVWDRSSQTRPSVSNLNAARTTIANMFTYQPAKGGSYLWLSAGPTAGEHAAIDITGYFT
jgi:hypothetical protein